MTRSTRYCRFVVALLLAAAGAGCASTPIPKPLPGSWLVFLCKASDAPAEPQPVEHYKELFDKNKADLLSSYLDKSSESKVDVSGSEVYGWFSMSVTTAEISPAARNNTTPIQRTQTAQDCKSASVAAILATGRTINPDDYVGVVTVINVPVDAGQAGPSLVANAAEPVAFYAHEMLHHYGLEHSMLMAPDLSQDHSWELGADTQYNDCWDIMSYATCTHMFNTVKHGGTGPELQIAYRQKLGWVTPSRVFVKQGSDPAPSTVTLAPVSESAQSGSLMARIEMPHGETYVVEFRVPTRFDRGIPRSAVVIRELRRDGRTYLVRRQNGSTAWSQGEQFTDAGQFLKITVVATTPQSATITIDPRFVTTAGMGETCGNKFVGEIRTCPVGTQCSQRKTGQIVSTDYFCD